MVSIFFTTMSCRFFFRIHPGKLYRDYRGRCQEALQPVQDGFRCCNWIRLFFWRYMVSYEIHAYWIRLSFVFWYWGGRTFCLIRVCPWHHNTCHNFIRTLWSIFCLVGLFYTLDHMLPVLWMSKKLDKKTLVYMSLFCMLRKSLHEKLYLCAVCKKW